LQTERTTIDPRQEELLSLLRTRGLSIKDLDKAKREELRAFLDYLHNSRGLSLNDIARLIGNKTSGYTSWVCRQLGVQRRAFEEARLKGIREKRRKYERRPFDGTDEDSAYLLGLRHGDLSVSRPWKGVVRVSTSTTHPAMVKLFRSLFEPFGHVYQAARYKKDTNTYEWNLMAIVDNSFEFLLQSRESAWAWVSTKESTLLGYLAGVLDAEGSIGIYGNGSGIALQLLFYNTHLELLRFIYGCLVKLGYGPLGPYLDKKRGTLTSKYGIVRRKDYWKIALARFDQVQDLLPRLPIRHPEKVPRKQLALSLALSQPWDDVAPRIEELRKSIRLGRDAFVGEARASYLEHHSSKKEARSEENSVRPKTAVSMAE